MPAAAKPGCDAKAAAGCDATADRCSAAVQFSAADTATPLVSAQLLAAAEGDGRREWCDCCAACDVTAWCADDGDFRPKCDADEEDDVGEEEEPRPPIECTPTEPVEVRVLLFSGDI
jgi:hypothetical protein